MKKQILFAAIIAVLTLAGCSSSPDEIIESNEVPNLSDSSVTLVVGESIHVLSDMSVTWSADSKFVAMVSNGTIIGSHVGETVVMARTKAGKEAKVSVSVIHSADAYYRDPVLQWGMTSSDIWLSIRGKAWNQTYLSGLCLIVTDSMDAIKSGSYSYYTNNNKGLYGVGVKCTFSDTRLLWFNESYAKVMIGDSEYYANALTYEDATVLMSYTLNENGKIATITYMPNLETLNNILN